MSDTIQNNKEREENACPITYENKQKPKHEQMKQHRKDLVSRMINYT